MLLIYLKPVVLKKAEKQKQANGTYKNTYNVIDTYKVQKQRMQPLGLRYR